MKKKEEYNKLRGGYYTPSEITEFICDWIINDDTISILEPSCGDGAFIKSLCKRIPEKKAKKQILGIELDKEEARKANKYNANIINDDFFTYYENEILNKKKFDCVVGNPPFIRYQNFNKESREKALKMIEKFNIKLNKLTNIWLPFLILSSYSLKEDGKLGMVIPSELLQVDYASEGRKFLAEFFERITIINFKKLLFENAQQEVIVLLAEKKATQKGIRTVELDSLESLNNFSIEDVDKLEIKTLRADDEKWTRYYLDNEEIKLLDKIEDINTIHKTTDLFEINVGLVTGENNFFLLNEEEVNKMKLNGNVDKIVGRAEQLPGVILNEDKFDKLVKKGKKVFLFSPKDGELDINSREYVSYGEQQNVNKGYKCRIRKQWYMVPKTWGADAFILRQVHKYPKMIYNSNNVLNTDTIHKVRFKENVNPENVISSFINSYTFVLCELTGRSYGGGVLTFEPNEIRKLKIPIKNSEKLNLKEIDKNITNNEIEKTLDENDKVLLEEGIGLSKKDIAMLRNIWKKLSERRINRKLKYAGL